MLILLVIIINYLNYNYVQLCFFRNNGMVLLNVDALNYYHKQFKLYLCAIFLADDHYFYGKGAFGAGSNN